MFPRERERERERENGSLPRPELEILRVNNYYFVARTLSFCPLPQTHSLEFTVLTVVLMERKQRGERWKEERRKMEGREEKDGRETKRRKMEGRRELRKENE